MGENKGKQDMSTLVVNKDFVYVVIQNDNLFEKKQLLIPQSCSQVLSEFDKMRNCDMFSLLEVQDSFSRFFPEKVYSSKEYSYVYPESYGAANINLNYHNVTIRYPKLLSEQEYEALLDMFEVECIRTQTKDNKILTNRFKDFEEKNTDSSPATFKLFMLSNLSKIDLEKIKIKVDEHEKTLKKEFIDKLIKFIYAHQYAKLIDDFSNNDEIKMFSTEQCGRKSNRFHITDNVEIIVESNFAYGRSSYFRCILTYHGVKILSYASYVHYYYAKMKDICRCTRAYENSRSEWTNIFDFVVRTVNLIRQDPKGFEQTFIIKEVNEMVERLREICEKPEIVINKLKNKTNQISEGYSFVRNFKTKNTVNNATLGFVSKIDHDEDVELFAVYPKEKVIVDKICKVSGALQFLDNLKQLSNILPEINAVIDELSNMNIQLLPQLDNTIELIGGDIDDLKEQLSVCKCEILLVNESATVFFDELTELNHGRKISNFSDVLFEGVLDKEFESLEQKYCLKNQRYNDLKKQFEELYNNKNELEKFLRLRYNLLNSLNGSKNAIKRILNL